MALCDRMRVSWHELQETPAEVVQDYLAVIEAEAQHASDQQRRLGERTHR